MTDQDAAIGALVREYTENNKTIAALRVKLDVSGDALIALGSSLRDLPHETHFANPDFVVGLGRRIIEGKSCDIEAIKTTLEDFKACNEKRRRMEERLRSAGMESLIRSDAPRERQYGIA